MIGFFTRLFGKGRNDRFGKASSKVGHKRSSFNYQPALEPLETRCTPASLGTEFAILDFDGEYLTAAQMAEGGWAGKGAMSVASFHSLFTAAHAYLDFDGNGMVNGTDANLAIQQIMNKVKQDFAPYQLAIFQGDQDTYQWTMTDSHIGDVMVIITGDDGFAGSGVAPWSDLGNEHDEIVWVWGNKIVDATSNRDSFVNRIARTISHEMGHAFGLGHLIDATENPDAVGHHLMTYVNKDFAHDFNFQDLYYHTDVFDYAHHLSSAHPEFNTDYQNAHQYLSHPDVLGSSTGSWVAALRPGELTVHGTNAANNITINPGAAANEWVVTIDGVSITLDASSPDIHSLNPYSVALTKIFVHGKDGNDSITLNASMTARLFAYAGAGDDVVHGGAGNDYMDGWTGNDYLYGHGGDDTILGWTGNDHIYGSSGNDNLYGEQDDDYIDGWTGNDFISGGSGNDSLLGWYGNDTIYGGTGNDYLYGEYDSDVLYGQDGNDVLYGGSGNDSLYGGNGADSLYGQDGNDYLDGGDDSDEDQLSGGPGADTFVQHKKWYWWGWIWGQDSINDMDGSDSVFYV